MGQVLAPFCLLEIQAMDFQFSLNDLMVLGIGLFSQVLFFARILVQWFKSEKAGKVLSPVLFWQISLVASILMLVYGILRRDFAIVLGQVLVYFIYIRNLQLQGAWKKLPVVFKGIAWLMPLACMGWIFTSETFSLQQMLGNDDVAQWLMVWGVVAQVVFTSRFFYQWIFSERNKESVLPVGFWYLSIVGSSMILFYGVMRLDLVLLLGQLGGLGMYLRNLILHYTGRGLFDILPFDIRGIVQKYRPKGKR